MLVKGAKSSRGKVLLHKITRACQLPEALNECNPPGHMKAWTSNRLYIPWLSIIDTSIALLLIFAMLWFPSSWQLLLSEERRVVILDVLRKNDWKIMMEPTVTWWSCWFLQSLSGVEAAEVALESGIARIHVAASGQLDAFYTQLPRLVDAIRQLGFDAEPHFGDYEED